MTEQITTTVIVARVQTMADGGLRFTFDAPETEIFPAAQFMECKRAGIVGKLTFEPIEQQEESTEEDGEQRETKRNNRKIKF